MTAALATVRSFIAALEARDFDLAGTFVSDDLSYENVPMQPIHGRAAMVQVLTAFMGAAEEVDWVIVREVAQDGVVMNERVDRFKFPGGWVELPVAGVFELDADGRIRLWRDFFDLATYTSQMAAIS